MTNFGDFDWKLKKKSNFQETFWEEIIGKTVDLKPWIEEKVKILVVLKKWIRGNRLTVVKKLKFLNSNYWILRNYKFLGFSVVWTLNLEIHI